MLSPSFTIPTTRPTTSVPRGANILRLIFHDHFPAFAQSYDSLYAQDYGTFRLERISHVAERFESCGGVRAHIESPVERELGSRQFPILRVNRVT